MKQVKATTKRRQKNYFITLILLLIFWAITGGIIGFIEPELVKDLIIPHSYLVFFSPLFLACFLTLSIILVNSRRGFLSALGIIVFLILRLHELGNLLNLFLVAGFIAAADYYFTQKH